MFIQLVFSFCFFLLLFTIINEENKHFKLLLETRESKEKFSK